MKIPLISKKKKVFKVNTMVFQRIGRVVLWTLIILLLFKGIGAVVRANDGDLVASEIENFISTRTYEEKTAFEAAAFAQRFAMAYFTYDGRDRNQYIEGLRSFLPSNINIGNIGQGTSMKALNSYSYGVDWVSENQLNVLVAVKVEYSTRIQEEEETITTVQIREEFLKVPIKESAGTYLVEDLPVFIPAPEKSSERPNTYTATNLDSNIMKEIEESLQNFFRTYYSGSPGEIQYYMESGERIRGLEGSYSLHRLENVRGYMTEKENEFFVLVELSIRDELSKHLFNQNFNVTLTRRGGRYYIKDFDARTVNLN